MLQIRDTQREQMVEEAWSQSVSRIVAFMEEEFPEMCARAGDDGITESCEKAMRVAIRFDLADEADVAGYVYATLLFGEDFELEPDHSWALSILQDGGPDSGDRLWEAIAAHQEETLQI